MLTNPPDTLRIWENLRLDINSPPSFIQETDLASRIGRDRNLHHCSQSIREWLRGVELELYTLANRTVSDEILLSACNILRALEGSVSDQFGVDTTVSRMLQISQLANGFLMPVLCGILHELPENQGSRTYVDILKEQTMKQWGSLVSFTRLQRDLQVDIAILLWLRRRPFRVLRLC
jgi:hypothetical protein